jgi:hypothetical protein
MHRNCRRGLFRCLVVVAVVGAGYAGLTWQKWSDRPEDDCWSRIAKWPDGLPFSVFDLFEQANTPANVELNKKRDAWAAESIVTRNQWVVSTRQKLYACETGAPVESLQGQASSVWTNLKNSLLGLTIPPLAILIVAWIASGFRVRATEPLPEPAMAAGLQADVSVSESETGIESDGSAAASPVLAQNVSRRRGHGRSFGRGRPSNAPAESSDPTADDFRAIYSMAEWPVPPRST